MVFFRPNDEFINWLKKYAGGRVVVDVGCGEGCLLYNMMKAEIPCVGVDPYFPVISDPDRDFETPFGNIVRQKGETSRLIQNEKALVVIARPCHNGFCEKVILNKGPKTEALYIGLPRNVEEDLGDLKYEIISDFEIGDEGEKVYKIL